MTGLAPSGGVNDMKDMMYPSDHWFPVADYIIDPTYVPPPVPPPPSTTTNTDNLCTTTKEDDSSSQCTATSPAPSQSASTPLVPQDQHDEL
jgi:hypothetical protein